MNTTQLAVNSNFIKLESTIKSTLCINNNDSDTTTISSYLSFSNNSNINNTKIIFNECANKFAFEYTNISSSIVLASEQRYLSNVAGGAVLHSFKCYDNTTTCSINCNNSVSCFASTFLINTNSTIIQCDSIFACGYSIINTSHYTALDSLHIICSKYSSCIQSQIIVASVNEFSLDCIDSRSCADTIIHISDTTKTSISCHQIGSCDSPSIFSDSDNIELSMHQFSQNVLFNSPFGDTGNNLICNPNKAYIVLEEAYSVTESISHIFPQLPSNAWNATIQSHYITENRTQFKPKSYILPLHDVEELIKRLQNFCNKHTSKTRNKSTQHLNIFFKTSPRNAKTITPRQNIKSIKKRPSGSSVHPFSKRKKTKQKLKSDKKTVKNDNYGKYNLHRIKDYDYTDAYINNKNNTLCPSPLFIPASNTLPQSKSSRRSSIRSFGSLYSDEFKQHDDYLGLTQLKIVEFYHNDYIGQNELFESPFGIRPIIYCDWTASGKALHCVENYINNEMLPLYANTHTTTSITGIQTSKFRSEARSIILESIGGDTNEDVIIFTGNRSTAAIYKIANVLIKQNGYKPANTVVFISIYEHNSNIFIWKELGCKVIVIPECNNNNNSKGGLDLNILEKHLKFYTSTHMKHKYNLLIGSFSAASNVSGIIAPVDECTLLLHKYNALSFWDYATAGPYMNVNMTNKQNHMLSKDAIFISPHKYLGGPGSPGILCAKKKLFLNYTPVVPGGGTVFIAYGVNDGQWEYLDNIEEREEGGTPDIIGSIRASFAFMIKDHLTTEFIENRENEYLKYFFKHCKSICNLVIMGNNECKRLPVISFLITHTKNGFGAAKKTKYLHYNFIAALMNDLFGIQGRGGCACAGMYGKYVLNMSMNQVDHIVEQLRSNKNELSRPGYFRINLHYTLTKNELNYIINAIKFVCNKGWLFLPLYDVDIESGNYFHRDTKLQKQLHSLLDISFNTNQMKWKKKKRNNKSFKGKNLNKYFEIADNIILNLNEYLPNINQFKNDTKICDETAWYWIPSELYQAARNYTQ